MTEEDKQHVRERRQRHYTKRRYEKELLAIVNDESVPAKERHEALFTPWPGQRLPPTPDGQEIAI
jgi:hypothetical protein